MKTVRFSSYDAEASCDGCDFWVGSKNAHGLAAQHHYKTGHTVHITVERTFTMTTEGSEWHEDWKRIRERDTAWTRERNKGGA